MNDHDQNRSERSLRIQTFGLDNTADFDPAGNAAGWFRALDIVILKIAAARVGQLRTPVTKEALLLELVADFKNIARTARSIDQTEPGFLAPYHVPASRAESELVTHAEALLKLLEDNTAPVADGGDSPDQLAAKADLRAKFTGYEMAADFVEDLRADREALRVSNSAKTSDNLEGVENTGAIATHLGQAQELITHLDAVMHNKYSRDPDKLRAWKSATHVKRAAKRIKKTDGGTTPPPPAA